MKTFIDSVLSGETFSGLSKSMDLTWKRNQAIASNIANSETPGYRAVDLNFGQELEKAFNEQTSTVAFTHPKHLDAVNNSNSHTVQDLTGTTKPDGNNVDLDIQMGRLAYNKGKYSLAANLFRKKMKILTAAIRQG